MDDLKSDAAGTAHPPKDTELEKALIDDAKRRAMENPVSGSVTLPDGIKHVLWVPGGTEAAPTFDCRIEGFGTYANGTGPTKVRALGAALESLAKKVVENDPAASV